MFCCLPLQELHNTLESRLGLRLPPTVIFDFPTVSAITGFVGTKLAAQTRPPAAAAQQRARPAVLSAALLPVGPLQQLPTAAAVPIEALAVVGVACRLPQDVKLAVNLAQIDTVSRVPYNCWDLAFASELAGEQQTSFGSFVPGVDGFDAAAFGLPEAETVLLDPQQRLLMELAWELLAGTAALGRASSNGGSAADAAAYRAGCGAFVGVSSRDYFTLGKQYSQVKHQAKSIKQKASSKKHQAKSIKQKACWLPLQHPVCLAANHNVCYCGLMGLCALFMLTHAVPALGMLNPSGTFA
jgi:hypothetical protein